MINEDYMTSARAINYNASLDGIRGVAVLLVMLFHFTVGFKDILLINGNIFSKAFFALANIGWVGVDIFFVLSGFLITSILMTTKNSTNYYSAFYLRRMCRIFPLYF